nr:D-serine ammonia-lyase [Variovorax sp. dw_954]
MSPAISAALSTKTPLLWLNPERGHSDAGSILTPGFDSAERRLQRAVKLMHALFPEADFYDGRVESPLISVPDLQRSLDMPDAAGKLFIKADHLLPVVGSVKARGGFHEVLAHAEQLAIEAGLLVPSADLVALASPEGRALFASRTISVGSTGNLGLSIGTIAAALGFRAVVHMSHEAKAWKKQELRRRGVEVVEHQGDYASAVEAGRRAAEQDGSDYFIDDEDSTLLLDGYATAASYLAVQLAAVGRTPSADKPLFVYLPCGVGGAPGGIALGLSRLFGSTVHFFFAEPVSSPCMLLKMASGGLDDVSVYDYGLDNQTQADGLAVPQASSMVAARIRAVLSGVFTVTDEQLFSGLLRAWEAEALELEPSAAAGFAGPQWITSSDAGLRYMAASSIDLACADATHLLWTTGGSMVPTRDRHEFRERARQMESQL